MFLCFRHIIKTVFGNKFYHGTMFLCLSQNCFDRTILTALQHKYLVNRLAGTKCFQNRISALEWLILHISCMFSWLFLIFYLSTQTLLLTCTDHERCVFSSLPKPSSPRTVSSRIRSNRSARYRYPIRASNPVARR